MKLFSPYPRLWVSEDTRRFDLLDLRDTLRRHSIRKVYNVTTRSPDERLALGKLQNVEFVHSPLYDVALDEQGLAAAWKIAEQITIDLKDELSVLINCYNAYNRSFFVAGLVMRNLGVPRKNVVQNILEVRPIALKNKAFKKYLLTGKAS
tara:strand:+ start:2741 stop:3190 length:450 start_codon:yes stop_codon:yes gene_type:complete